MNQRWNILLKGLAAIGAIIIICISITKLTGIGSETLGDIAREHPQPTATPRVTEEDPLPSASPGVAAEDPLPSASPDGLAGDSMPPESRPLLPMNLWKVPNASRRMCRTQTTMHIIQGI